MAVLNNYSKIFLKKVLFIVPLNCHEFSFFLKAMEGRLLLVYINNIQGNILQIVFFSQTKSENLLLTCQPNGFVSILYSIYDEVKYPPYII